MFQITEEYNQVHVIKGTVNACEINDDQDKFCNNSLESMSSY